MTNDQTIGVTPLCERGACGEDCDGSHRTGDGHLDQAPGERLGTVSHHPQVGGQARGLRGHREDLGQGGLPARKGKQGRSSLLALRSLALVALSLTGCSGSAFTGQEDLFVASQGGADSVVQPTGGSAPVVVQAGGPSSAGGGFSIIGLGGVPSGGMPSESGGMGGSPVVPTGGTGGSGGQPQLGTGGSPVVSTGGAGGATTAGAGGVSAGGSGGSPATTPKTYKDFDTCSCGSNGLLACQKSGEPNASVAPPPTCACTNTHLSCTDLTYDVPEAYWFQVKCTGPATQASFELWEEPFTGQPYKLNTLKCDQAYNLLKTEAYFVNAMAGSTQMSTQEVPPPPGPVTLTFAMP